jgi:hypothetical protein
MPAPSKTMLAQLAKTLFTSKAIQLPLRWQQPGSQYNNAFSASQRNVAPNAPTTLFAQATTNHFHVLAAREIGAKFEAYIDGICDGICGGIDQWLKAATIAGVVINGPAGMLPPGGVIGPPLGPLILAGAPMTTPQESKYSMAIANAMQAAWMAWSSGLTGMLMYPPFAACPAPVAPPTPNVPAPLVTLSSAGESLLAPSPLAANMNAMLGDPAALHATELFDSIANAFAVVFVVFKASTLVQNVIGTGPVPTFAPPFVPMGPVVAGVGTGAAGCIK